MRGLQFSGKSLPRPRSETQGHPLLIESGVKAEALSVGMFTARLEEASCAHDLFSFLVGTRAEPGPSTHARQVL